MQVHDVIGVGFGPSNLALAITLRETPRDGRPLSACFIEKQRNFAWHREMMLDHAHMQISFLKDLATMRDPRSRFTFVNYLHSKGRLADFINLKTFFPSRREFNDYLSWAASHFEDECAYGEEVFEVRPEPRDGRVGQLRVRSRDAQGNVRERLARNLVLGIGGSAHIPSCFASLPDGSPVFHSSRYLGCIDAHARARRIAVVGAGQSAAELFMDLHGRLPGAHVDLIMRGRAMRPSDDSPFVNEIFNAEFTDYMYRRDPATRAALLDEFWHTNYAAPDLDLVQRMFAVFYEQKVSGQHRHRLLRRHETRGARRDGAGIELDLRDLDTGAPRSERYDAVVLATGYAHEHHKTLLAPLSPHLGELAVDRNYRVVSDASLQAGIFLQGACETSHGLSDTLLSVTSIRANEILDAMLQPPHNQAESVLQNAAESL